MTEAPNVSDSTGKLPSKSSAIERYVCLISFVALLAVGLTVFRDYGVSNDELSHLLYGVEMADYVFKGAPLPTRNVVFYGPVFDLTCFGLIKAVGATDIRDILLTKHLATFLLFAFSVAAFYFLCKRYFGKWVPAYIACLFLVLHPRIFAQSFFNPKDVPFLASLVIGCATLVWFLDKRTWYRGLLHGLASAVCIDIRVLGIMLPCMTVLFGVLDALVHRGERRIGKSDLMGWAMYGSSVVAVVILFWPYLWSSPIERFINVMRVMGNFPYPWPVLYLGRFYLSADLPWHYPFVWIGLTTPIAVTAAFLVGMLELPGLLRDTLKGKENFRTISLLPYVWLLVPIGAVVVLHSALYNGWRQLFFIYPAICMISVRGLVYLWEGLKTMDKSLVRRAAVVGLVSAVVLDLVGVAVFMVKWHPHQYLYFNRLAGGLAGTRGKMEWDYYGLAHRDLLECLVQWHRGQKPLRVVGCGMTYRNIAILEPAKRSRLRLVGIIDVSFRYLKPDNLPLRGDTYYLTDLHGGLPGWTATFPAACEVEVDGGTVARAVRLKKPVSSLHPTEKGASTSPPRGGRRSVR